MVSIGFDTGAQARNNACSEASYLRPPDKDTILKLYPKARWFPWDEPPVGLLVNVSGDPPYMAGRVVGAYKPKPYRLHECPDCTHLTDPPESEFRFWLIRLINPLIIVDGRNEGHVDRLVYPPTLEEVGEVQHETS